MTLAAGLPAAPSDAIRPAPARARWPYLGFVLIAAVFGWELLLAGRILLPTNPATLVPWFGDAAPESAAVPSNGLMMDTLIFTWPARVYNAEMLRQGEIPFWNPSVFNGYPHFALIQNNVLYPLSTIFDLIEPVSGMGFSILLHLTLAGCFMFAFLRARGLPDDAAFLGAAAFELNGMFLIRVSAPSYVFSGTWLPLMLLGALRLARSTRLRDGWPLLIATTGSVLGGHPQITSLCLTLAGTFVLVETWALHRERAPEASVAQSGLVPTIVRAAVAFGALAVLGVGIAGYQVVPFLELMANSARGGVALDAYRNASMPVTGLLQAIIPDVFGHPIEMDYWFPDTAQLVDGIEPKRRVWALNFSGQNVYTGLVPLALAAVAVLRTPARRDVVTFALAALFAIGVVLGTPLIDVAYALIPGFRHSRPDRILFVYMASLSVLTAYGYAALRGHALRRGSRAVTIAIVALALAIVLWPIAPRLASTAARADLAAWLAHARAQWALRRSLLVPEVLWTTAGAIAIAVLALAPRARRLATPASLAAWSVLLLAPSLWFGWRFNPMQHWPVLGATTLERQVQALAQGERIARILPGLPQALPANVLQLLGVDDVHGASAAGVGGYLELIDAADPGSVAARKYFRAFRDPAVANGHILDLLSARLVLANVELPPEYERVGGEDGLTLYRNPDVLPRFRLVRDVATYASPEEGRARLLAPDFDPRTTVLVQQDDAALANPRAHDRADTRTSPDTVGHGHVRMIERSAHAIRLEIETPEPAVLASSEVFYPGWTTRIDGAPAPTLRVNTAFRGTLVPTGKHVVEMIYVPRAFHLGLALTVASLLIAIVIWRPRRARPAHSTQAIATSPATGA